MPGSKRILVVDDEPAIRYTVEDVLTDAGFRVVTAEDGVQALEEVYREKPDAILLDLTMPVMDGWTFLGHCRTEPTCAGIPVVVMSASHALRRSEPRLPPVEAVLSKPFDLDDLISVVSQLF